MGAVFSVFQPLVLQGILLSCGWLTFKVPPLLSLSLSLCLPSTNTNFQGDRVGREGRRHAVANVLVCLLTVQLREGVDGLRETVLQRIFLHHHHHLPTHL